MHVITYPWLLIKSLLVLVTQAPVAPFTNMV